MSSSTSQDTEMLIYSKEASWNNSLESLLAQKIAKITKSESLFQCANIFNPNLTLSELEFREARIKNFKSKPPKWEVVPDKQCFPRKMQTKSLLRDELEMLRINLSMQDKFISKGETQDIVMTPKKIKKRGKRRRCMRNHLFPFKTAADKVKDLLTEIDGSESANTDTIVWKFLKRGPSFRKQYINTRKLFIELQALHFPGLSYLSNSRFHNPKPVKVTCPNCGFFITTRIKKVSTVKTKLTSFILATIGLCFIPHVVYAFKDTVHLCPLCKIYLGFCPAFGIRSRWRALSLYRRAQREHFSIEQEEMVSASSTSAKNLFVESKLRLSDRVQVNVNNIAAISRQIQRGSKANENLIAAAKNFAMQESAIENSEANLKKLQLLSTHINNQLDSLHNSSSKMELVLEQVRSMQR